MKKCSFLKYEDGWTTTTAGRSLFCTLFLGKSKLFFEMSVETCVVLKNIDVD